jgi:hypothetical protein
MAYWMTRQISMLLERNNVILKKTIIIKRKKLEYLINNGGDPFSKLVYKNSNAVSRKHLKIKTYAGA